jgi:hypothetical protein
MATKPRRQLSHEAKVRIFVRDRWLCHWCRRAVIFGPALRHAELLVQEHQRAAMYYDYNYRRDRAPLLDDLAAVIDHVQPLAEGGLDVPENCVRACNKIFSS